jgi:hypothetical protein
MLAQGGNLLRDDRNFDIGLLINIAIFFKLLLFFPPSKSTSKTKAVSLQFKSNNVTKKLSRSCSATT